MVAFNCVDQIDKPDYLWFRHLFSCYWIVIIMYAASPIPCFRACYDDVGARATTRLREADLVRVS